MIIYFRNLVINGVKMAFKKGDHITTFDGEQGVVIRGKYRGWVRVKTLSGIHDFDEKDLK